MPNKTHAEVSRLLSERRAALQEIAGPGVNVDRLIKLALLQIATMPVLEECSPASLFKTICLAADVGLEIGSALEHAYFVPYGKEADLSIGYRGYQHLMLKSGLVRSSIAHIVYEKDVFEINRKSLGDSFVHKPEVWADPGRPIGAYAVAYFGRPVPVLGSPLCQLEWMTWKQIMAIKERALQRGGRRGGSPWNTDEEQQARKTPLRRIAKYMPLAPAARLALVADIETEDLSSGEQTELALERSEQATKEALKYATSVGVIDAKTGRCVYCNELRESSLSCTECHKIKQHPNPQLVSK